MKKVLFILFNLLTITVMAQTKGRFEVHDLGNYKLHVYYTHDALGDASYIIEGENGLVTMEQPLFKDNVAEFDTYLSRLWPLPVLLTRLPCRPVFPRPL